jgi:hypothetical protein
MDVLRIFLTSFGMTKTLEETNTELSRAKTLHFGKPLLQHLLSSAVDQTQEYAEQFVLEGLLVWAFTDAYSAYS